MKKWLIITNVWGKKKNKFGNLIDTFREEREYFDTLEDLKAYIKLFEDICKTYEIPKEYQRNTWDRKHHDRKPVYKFENENQRIWGYVVGNTETQTIEKWGGISLQNLSKRDSMLRQKDYLFRGHDEIPKNYKWDVGEYEGWLQYRWGDRKNALDYVEPEKPKKEKKEEVEDDYDWQDCWALTTGTEEQRQFYLDEMENSFLREEDKEKLKKISERW